MLNRMKFLCKPFNIITLFSLLVHTAIWTNPVLADSVITVNTNTDVVSTNGLCSLREAVINSNNDDQTHVDCISGSGRDIIQFSDALGTTTITLSSTLPDITDTDGLTINGGNDISIDGNNSYRIIILLTGVPLTLNEITLTNANSGSGSTGGAVYNAGLLTVTSSIFTNNDGGTGGAIANTGGSSTLSIENSTFSGNTAAQLGGAIYSDVSTTITNSTFTNNNALSFASGGGIYVINGTLTVTNSTFISNSAGQNGGGIASQATTTISNSTFSGNTATQFGGGFFGNSGNHTLINNTFSANTGGTGSGIYNSGILNLKNTILANSTIGVDCYNSSGDTIAANMHNLIETNGPSGHMCGTPTLTSDPGLAALANNGGPTQTFALLLSSPALGAGDNTACDDNPGPNNLDQRGVTRPQQGGCDIGAYESNAQPGPNFIVNTNEDTTDGFCDDYLAGVTDCTLREAITYANSVLGNHTISFAANYTITLTSQLPAMIGTISINGNGITNTIIQANAAPDTATYRIFEISTPGDVTLNNLTIRNGRCDGSCSVHGEDGGGIYNAGTLSANNILVSENTAPGDIGGGLYNEGGTVTISESTFSNNSSYNAGAGIATSGIMTISNSTIANNSATGNTAGGIYNEGILKIYNSTISGNTSNSVIFEGDNIYQNGTSLELYNTIIANSTDHGDCGINGGTVTAKNSLIESTGAFACGLLNGTNGNIIGSDPALGLLTGSPAYFPLISTSPAINTGNDAVCAAAPVNGLDQRGTVRPFGAHCDIGAIEYVSIPLAGPWVGSVSISSDKNVVAVGRPHIGSEIASYDGASSGATSAYVPMLFKDAFGGSYDAALYVQNVSGSSANITIKFYDSTGTLSCTKNDTVSSLASKGYWLPSESCLPAGWVGGALVTSDQNIVAIGRPHIGAEVMTYNGFSAGSTSASIPMLFKDAFGGSYDAAFYIQNIHPSNTANLTINFYDSSGALSCTKNDTLSPLASKGYWVPAESCLPTGWVGGVIVTSDQPIVSVGRPHIGSQITTYNGFSSGATSSFIPMLFKDAFGGSYDSAFYLQNTHSSNTANLTIQFYDSAGTLSCTKNDTLAPFASKGFWVPAESCLPAGWVGGVIVTSDQPIVGVGRPHIGAQITTYNGFSSGSSSSFLSMLFKDAFGGSYDSAFYVQNTEASQATVTTEFYDSTGALTCSRTDTIQPKATLGIWLPSATCTP